MTSLYAASQEARAKHAEERERTLATFSFDRIRSQEQQIGATREALHRLALVCEDSREQIVAKALATQRVASQLGGAAPSVDLVFDLLRVLDDAGRKPSFSEYADRYLDGRRSGLDHDAAIQSLRAR